MTELVHPAFIYATSPQNALLLLHNYCMSGQTLRNFATVKQKLKINSLGRKKFFPGQEKNDDCGRWNVEWSAEPMKNEE